MYTCFLVSHLDVQSASIYLCKKVLTEGTFISGYMELTRINFKSSGQLVSNCRSVFLVMLTSHNLRLVNIINPSDVNGSSMTQYVRCRCSSPCNEKNTEGSL